MYGRSTYYELPKHLSSLSTDGYYNGWIVLPKFMSSVLFGHTYSHPCVMDHLVETVHISGFAHCSNIADNLPNNPKIITLIDIVNKRQGANIPNFTKIITSDNCVDYVRDCT